MRKALLRILGVLLLVGFLAVLFGPYEPLEPEARFDASALAGGVSPYLAAQEAQIADLRSNVEKQVVWAGAPETRSDVALVYLHGFTATREEIRPVPDDLARALGANLVFTRFTGHGRDGPALAEATASDWMRDAAEALAIGRAVGDRLIVIGTSTGGTIATAALHQEALRADVAGVILVSPNFAVNHPAAPLMTWPAARAWLPLLFGEERIVEVRSPAQEAYWTTRFPSVAVLPMARIVEHVSGLDLGEVPVPALFYFSDDDKVVRADVTRDVAARWGGPVTLAAPELGPEDDPFAHVIAGHIMSPAHTEAATARMLAWIRSLGLTE